MQQFFFSSSDVSATTKCVYDLCGFGEKRRRRIVALDGPIIALLIR
jgi:hypothetical protein